MNPLDSSLFESIPKAIFTKKHTKCRKKYQGELFASHMRFCKARLKKEKEMMAEHNAKKSLFI